MNYKKIISVILIVIGIIILVFKPNFSYMDNNAKEFIDKNLKETLISYAIIRGINAGVSIIKHSEISMEPGGMGVSVAVGEVLDPIDDLTERVSDFLFIVLIVYGALEVIFNISIVTFYYLFPISLFILSFGIFQKKLLKIAYFLLVISLIRFLFIFVAFSGNYVNNYFQKEIITTQNNLKLFSTIKNQNFNVPQTSNSLWSSVKDSFSYVKNQTNKIKQKFSLFINNASKIINNLVTLAYLYFGMFLINFVFIPLLIYLFFRELSKILYE